MISLIVTTRNRVEQLHELLASLEAQTYKSFEVIVVDQNVDDRLVEVLAQHPSLNIRHLRSGPGASRGRNAGLRAFEGDVVAFPDDDCWYSSELLAGVVAWLDEHPEYDGLMSGFCNPEGKSMAPMFAPGEGPCHKDNILRCSIAWNIFLRARAARTVGFFREEMGPGAASPYQSGEDLDYPIRVLKHGFRLWYAPRFKVYHPNFKDQERPVRLRYQYALGVGRVWRMHGYSRTYCLWQIAFCTLGGAVLALCAGNPKGSFHRLIRAAGELRGYMQQPESLLAPETGAGYEKP